MGGPLLFEGTILTATSTSRLPEDTLGEALGYLAENLRQPDVDETFAMLGLPPSVAIPHSVQASSQSWLVTHSGLPIGVLGVAPSVHPQVGTPWMVATDELPRHGFSFARQSRHYIDRMNDEFPVLTNFVDARNEHSINWLLFTGFHLIDADPRHGPEERLFFQFSRSKT